MGRRREKGGGFKGGGEGKDKRGEKCPEIKTSENKGKGKGGE